MRTYQDAKAMAKSLRGSLASRKISLTHSECLEIVAQQLGFGEWNTLSAKLDAEAGRLTSPQVAGVFFQPPIPTLSVRSLQEAKPFYEDFLGFQFDWGFPEGNTYAQISRAEITLHLNADSRLGADSRLSGSAGMLIRMSGLDALHRELTERSGIFAPSEINFTPWDSRVFHVVDPFGNAMRFWENNPPGVAKPAER
jgi:predicted enzyme related to lactoylglutathione lyase